MAQESAGHKAKVESPDAAAADHSGIAILVVAAGRGTRAGDGLPKQYRLLAGQAVLSHTLRALQHAVPQARFIVVIHPDDHAHYEAAAKVLAHPLPAPVHGAASRQASVLAGLEALAAHPPKLVLIHDAARPFVSFALVARAIATAQIHKAAVPGLAVTDTIKVVDNLGQITATPVRAQLRAVQTPQAFDFALILAAHRAAQTAAMDNCSDDAAIAEWAGHAVNVFSGDTDNVKITTMEDFALAEARLRGALTDLRTGQGYDVHAFGPGDHVWLGGVRIPHSAALVGHSDADVLLHAITDAILGALADGDIGAHFPPSDPRWKGAASHLFLRDAMGRVLARGGVIAHVDATLICEMPKIGPHRDAIRASIAAIMGIDIGRVAVKATTSERLGFTGRNEGMAAMALASLRLPEGGEQIVRP